LAFGSSPGQVAAAGFSADAAFSADAGLSNALLSAQVGWTATAATVTNIAAPHKFRLRFILVLH